MRAKSSLSLRFTKSWHSLAIVPYPSFAWVLPLRVPVKNGFHMLRARVGAKNMLWPGSALPMFERESRWDIGSPQHDSRAASTKVSAPHQARNERDLSAASGRIS